MRVLKFKILTESTRRKCGKGRRCSTQLIESTSSATETGGLALANPRLGSICSIRALGRMWSTVGIVPVVWM
ncbi:MAG: hypothetical protein GY820_04775 [Gammaproteobacteria bacterium]|nr:hypothetical protein [Gammaproteobacteria bacterium]